MTRLIHLNGPPGIGKSTLAAMYADRHPGTLNLDIDTLHHLIGGWRDSEGRFHDHLRPLARAMAGAHLARGNDVVLPQYISDSEQLAGFESIASQYGADFLEVVLLDDRAAAIARFNARPRDTEWHRHNQALVADLGGDEFLGMMYDRLLNLLDSRPDAHLIESRPGAIDDTLDALETALGR
ncbi:MAG: AAA family ATPase [Micropruina sp.]|nr:AAA family ATPase [Micropruina sp.]